MTARLRKFLAVTQVAGGLSVLALPAMLSAQGLVLAWWYWVLLESFGGTAVAAGIWLWRSDPRGWWLSKLLQALQIVQFQTTSFGVGVLAGFQARLLVTETKFEVGPAFHGTLLITYGENLPWWFSINFFALYALYILHRAEPGVDASPPERPSEPESGSSAEPAPSVVPPWAPGMPPRFQPTAEAVAAPDGKPR